MKPTQSEVDDLYRRAEDLHAQADELESQADRLQREVDAIEHAEACNERISGYAEWVHEIHNHADIPQFQKNLIQELADSGNLKGSHLRLAYQSGGMMPPTDLIGLP